MTQTKHTPGPWEVKHSESKPAFNVVGKYLGGKYKIARCPYIADVKVEKEEAEANAKLIAAAPDMIEILKEVLPYLIGGIHIRLSLKVDAIIKKATK